MKMDYPDQKDWRLFYAQSVSLTRFLAEQGPPERFIQFVRDAQRDGAEAALRDVYQIDGLADLHKRWTAHARNQLAVETASGRDAEFDHPLSEDPIQPELNHRATESTEKYKIIFSDFFSVLSVALW